MAKLICIDRSNERRRHLTLHKSYDSIYVYESGYNKKSYKVLCDDGKERWELKKRFINLAEFREQRINKILE